MIDFKEDTHSLLHPKQERRTVVRRYDTLPNMELSFGSGIRLGHLRCGQLGLIRGDCQEERLPNRMYCYYHQKVLEGKIEPPQDMYPVWPLPQDTWQFAVDNN
jgi:hypothetical protein